MSGGLTTEPSAYTLHDAFVEVAQHVVFAEADRPADFQVHLSNSTDPFQRLQAESGQTRFALEQVLRYRRHFTSVVILTKTPGQPFLDLCRRHGLAT